MLRLLRILYATLSHSPPPQAMCLQVRDALTVGSISLSTHFFSVKMDVKEALKALGNELRYVATPAHRALPCPDCGAPVQWVCDFGRAAQNDVRKSAQNLLGKSRRRAGRRLHRAAARSHRIALLLYLGTVPLLRPQTTDTERS